GKEPVVRGKRDGFDPTADVKPLVLVPFLPLPVGHVVATRCREPGAVGRKGGRIDLLELERGGLQTLVRDDVPDFDAPRDRQRRGQRNRATVGGHAQELTPWGDAPPHLTGGDFPDADVPIVRETEDGRVRLGPGSRRQPLAVRREPTLANQYLL